METKKVFVVGSEQTFEVACAITRTVACNKCNVTLRFDKETTCDEAKGKLTNELSSEPESISNLIQTTISFEDAKSADIVIESVFEDKNLKIKTLKQLDDICLLDAIIATNSSTIPVTELGSATNRPDNIVGMHFIYFSPTLKVVELARGAFTSDATFSRIESFAKDLNLETAISEDAPGLLSTRIWMVHLNEAANNVFNKLVTPEALVKLNRTISPNALSILESADFIGIDNCVTLLQNLYYAYRDPKYAPSPLLTQMLNAGQLGVKTGKGFFNYS